MFGPNYLWVLPGYHRADWWHNSIISSYQTDSVDDDRVNAQRHSCTNKQINEVLQGHFALEFAPLRSYSSQILVSNRVKYLKVIRKLILFILV